MQSPMGEYDTPSAVPQADGILGLISMYVWTVRIDLFFLNSAGNFFN